MKPHRFAVLLLPLLLAAQNLQEFEKKVTEFTLPNGLHFIVVERHEAPVCVIHTYVNAGSVDDPSGAPASPICSNIWRSRAPRPSAAKLAEEKKAIDQEEAVHDRLDAGAEQGHKDGPSESRGARVGAEAAEEKAESFVSRIFTRASSNRTAARV